MSQVTNLLRFFKISILFWIKKFETFYFFHNIIFGIFLKLFILYIIFIIFAISLTNFNFFYLSSIFVIFCRYTNRCHEKKTWISFTPLEKCSNIFYFYKHSGQTYNVIHNLILSKKNYEIPQNKCINYSLEQILRNIQFFDTYTFSIISLKIMMLMTVI